MKILKRSFHWLMLILLGVLLLFLLLINTSGGSRWIIQQAINVSGQEVNVVGIDGTLANKIHSEKLTYLSGSEGLSITIEGFEFEWDASLLLKKSLHIKSLFAESVVVNTGKPKSTIKPSTDEVFILPAFSSPLTIQLDALVVNQLLIEGQGSPLQIDAIQLAAKIQGADLTITHLHMQQADFSVDGTGQLRLAQPFPLQTDLKLSQTTSDTSSTIEIKGELERYQVIGRANLQNEEYPVVDARFAGLGSLSELEIETLKLLTLNGEITASGKVQWQDELQASLLVNGHNLDPSGISKDMPGNLDLQGELIWKNEHYETNFNLSGQLRDYPLQLQLVADGSGRSVNITQAEFYNGPNQLDLKGKLSTDAIENLSWQLDAPKLATLHSDLVGQLAGEGQLNGSWKQLTGSGKLTGVNLRFQDKQLENFELKLKPLHNKAGHYQVSLAANGLKLEQRSVRQINITLTGSLNQQQTKYHLIDEADNQLQGQINSQKRKDQWQAELLDTQLKTKYWPALAQDKAATLSFENNAVELTLFCLQGDLESLCLKGIHDVDDTTALLTLEEIPLQRFKQWLSVSEDLDDKISGKVDIKRIKQAWAIQPILYLDDDNKFEAKVRLDQATKKLAGDIHVNFHKLEWLTLFSNQVLQPQGIITTDLTLRGTLDKPEIAGEVKLKQAGAKLPDAGIEITDLELTVAAIDNTKATIKGSAKSGNGDLDISGTAQWQPLDDWQLKLIISGKNFQLANLPEVRASASPDLSISIQNKRIDIKGSIDVPQALILLEELPDRAATISKDARIINDAKELVTESKSLPVYADIQLKFGDDVRLDGNGLEARLGGQMTIRESFGKPLQANGKIKIIEGSYTAYGQDLNLKQGNIIFNGPISQPGLDLKAQRKVDNIVAGLLIRGTLQNPQSEIFSIPAMPESDAIAYLLTGKPLRSSGSADGALLSSALTKLGVKGSAGLVEEIRNTTGLSTLEFDTGTDTTQTALLIGKYLTPQLYVQYVKRLFLESDSLQLQYDINENLKLEAESGTSQGIDFIYQFER